MDRDLQFLVMVDGDCSCQELIAGLRMACEPMK